MNKVSDIPKAEQDDLSTKTIMVIDNGLFCEIAKTLSKSFKRTLYYVPWKSSFPKSNQYIIGEGIEGIERIHDMFDHIDDVDIFVLPDIYDADLALYLEKQGKLVFSGFKGEEMELYRDMMKDHMVANGLYVTPYEVVIGIDALREYLKEHDNVFVKQNITRGDFETFHSKNYSLIEPLIDQLEHDLGAVKKDKKFIVEDCYDGVETGMDCYCINGKYPSYTLAGIEIKDSGYIGKFSEYKKLSPSITDFNDKMASTMEAFGYKGFFSTEIRISKDKPPYMVDFCARAGSPPSELYQLMYTNLADIVWYGAKGILIDPIVEHKFGVEALIHSSFADKNWLAIDFPAKYRENIKLRNACKIQGRYYCAPQHVGLPEVGAVVAIGDTLEEAIAECKKIAETVSGYYLEIKTDSFDSAKEEFAKLEKMGVKIL